MSIKLNIYFYCIGTSNKFSVVGTSNIFSVEALETCHTHQT
jgi:hypothetical protein